MAKTSFTQNEAFVASGNGSEESSKSAVAWAAIIGGAVAAAAVSITLLFLGSALGLSTTSPWRGEGISATGFTVLAAIWLIIMQWVSSGLGGYLTGRLRTKFVRMHDDEVFFRDTAHGFLTWAVATILTVTVVASGVTNVIGGGAKAAGGIAAGGAMAAGHEMAEHQGPGPAMDGGQGYYVDSLFRSDKSSANGPQDARGEATRILVKGFRDGNVSDEDKNYLAQLVASRANISQAEAKQRVENTIANLKQAEAKARKAADDARKASAKFALFTFLSLLVGAFVASVAAALGGKQRDEYHALANK